MRQSKQFEISRITLLTASQQPIPIFLWASGTNFLINTTSEALFFQIPGWYNSIVKRIYAGLYIEKKKADTKRTLHSHHYIEIEKLRKYLSGILYIENDKADLGKNMDQFINDKSDFDNTHFIKSNIQPVSNIREEERFISSMTPIEFRNGQDESRCYVNSSFQVLFSIYILEH